MNRLLSITLMLAASFVLAQAQTFNFDFVSNKQAKDDFIKVNTTTLYTEEQGYGYDLQPAWDGKSNQPFFFSVNVPDGNYKITITLGGETTGSTTVRGESRRLFIENLNTGKGEQITQTFTINKRNAIIKGNEKVKLKAREQKKLNWDDKLTFEFNGDAPRVRSLVIERVDNVPTVFLCGNSTVVDNDNEPWASWGQMIPRFFTDKVSIANYAESGLSANTFLSGRRLEKALTEMKKGDYVFVEFGHNDQKQKGPGKGAFYSFAYNLKIFIDEARLKGAIPVLITPTQRRRWKDGKIQDSHADYPDAVRWVAEREGIACIDLHKMTTLMCEALGEEGSKKLYVHYPVNTYPGQTKELKDNSHFSTYGAYEVAKCVIEGMKAAQLDVAKHLSADYAGFNPSHPDAFKTFKWNLSPFTEIEKPDGN